MRKGDRPALKKTSSTLWVAAFLLMETIIYSSFLTLDLLGMAGQTLWLKYAGVLLCLAFSLGRKSRMIAAAQILTVCADLFLLILQRRLLAGVLLFLAVQAIYALYLVKSGCTPNFPLRLCAAAAALILPFLADLATPLNLFALLCFSQLICNTAIAWSRPRLRLFALGLTLFACCDVCVGLFNSFALSPRLYHAVYVGMWLFYLPSQVLIVLSSKENCYETQ